MPQGWCVSSVMLPHSSPAPHPAPFERPFVAPLHPGPRATTEPPASAVAVDMSRRKRRQAVCAARSPAARLLAHPDPGAGRGPRARAEIPRRPRPQRPSPSPCASPRRCRALDIVQSAFPTRFRRSNGSTRPRLVAPGRAPGRRRPRDASRHQARQLIPPSPSRHAAQRRAGDQELVQSRHGREGHAPERQDRLQVERRPLRLWTAPGTWERGGTGGRASAGRGGRASRPGETGGFATRRRSSLRSLLPIPLRRSTDFVTLGLSRRFLL